MRANVHAISLRPGRGLARQVLLPLEINLDIFAHIGTVAKRAPIPGFATGTWRTHVWGANAIHFNRRIRAEVKLRVDETDRSQPAQIFIDFEATRQLPRLLYMIEEGVKLERLYNAVHAADNDPDDNDPEWLYYDRMSPFTADVAVHYFLDPWKYREVFERLSEIEMGQRILGSTRRDTFKQNAIQTSGAPPTDIDAAQEYHLRRFVRAMLARLRVSNAQNAEPFSPGHLEIVIEMPRDVGPFPDPDTRLLTVHEVDVIRYLYKYSKVFQDNLRLSFRLGRMEIAQPMDVTSVQKFRMYKAMSANDVSFRLTVDDQLL